VLSQQELFCWMGEHGTVPYEQKTQQSPGLGFSSSPQPTHSYKNWHAVVGMVSTA